MSRWRPPTRRDSAYITPEDAEQLRAGGITKPDICFNG
jgi:hypothetical protein